MAAFRNVSGMDLFLQEHGDVPDGQVVENVPEDELYQFTASANFEPVGKASKAAHDQAAAAEEAALEAEAEERRAASGLVDHPDAGADDTEPAAPDA